MSALVMTLLLHVAVLLVAPPLLVGFIQRTKARLAGRQGPPLLQLVFDLVKLLRKGTVRSATTTPLFVLGTALPLACLLVASTLVPLAGTAAPLAFAGDALAFVYLLALARFGTVLAALDTGSSFEGMGAAREVGFGALTEPAVALGLLVLARLSGSLSLSRLLAAPPGLDRTRTVAALVLVAAAWLLCLLAECSRVPVDDPATHLELTMIHEAMVLDHSGPALACVLYGAGLKLLLWSTLVVRVLLLPWAGAPGSALGAPLVAASLLGTLVLAVAIGFVESVMARLRLNRVPQLLSTASLLAAIGLVLLLRP